MLPGDENLYYFLSLVFAADLRVDASIGLGFDINQAPVRSIEGDDGMLASVVAEQDKGTPQPLSLGVVIDLGGEVAALILIEDKLVAVGGVSENKIPELLEGRVFELNSLAS